MIGKKSFIDLIYSFITLIIRLKDKITRLIVFSSEAANFLPQRVAALGLSLIDWILVLNSLKKAFLYFSMDRKFQHEMKQKINFVVYLY